MLIRAGMRQEVASLQGSSVTFLSHWHEEVGDLVSVCANLKNCGQNMETSLHLHGSAAICHMAAIIIAHALIILILSTSALLRATT